MNSTRTYPVEPKVWAATAATALVGAFINAVSNVVQDQDTGVLIGGGVPEWLEPFVTALLLAVPTFAAAWNAKHQYRPAEAAPIGAAVVDPPPPAVM